MKGKEKVRNKGNVQKKPYGMVESNIIELLSDFFWDNSIMVLIFLVLSFVLILVLVPILNKFDLWSL